MKSQTLQAAKDRIDEARQRRKHRCPTCRRLMELGRSCARATFDKTTGQFVHDSAPEARKAGA